jgi:hypothetical protein
MASAQHPNRVYFTSLDRSPVERNTDFTITFDTPIENSKNFEVVSAAFPNTFHQFAAYETVLYFYHELFNSGSVAIGVPLSITQFLQGGATGENPLPSARPAGREQYIDQRYFLDGTDLANYITDWLVSLSSSWPAASTGLCPFYFANDDPTNPPTFFANEAATGVTFSTLSFSYDNTTALGGTGSLKLVFADSSGDDVRVASVLDFGSLNTDYYYPSLLSYKLGYTDLVYESFNQIIPIDETNNQFVLYLTPPSGPDVSGTYTIPPNNYTATAIAAAIQDCLRTQNTSSALYTYVGATATVGTIPTPTRLRFTLTSIQSGLPLSILIDQSNPIQVACGLALGFPVNQLGATGGNLTGITAIPATGKSISPPQHLATDPINLIRTSNIYFASSLSAGEALSSAGRKDILFCVPLTAPIGSVQLYQSTLSGVIVNRPPDVVRNLRVSLLDDNFQVMEAMPQNSSISVEIHFSYDDENNTNNVSTNPYAQKA